MLLMRMLDEEFTRHPFYGSRRLSDWLGTQGHPACREKVALLMKIMGIEAIYPMKSLIERNPEHKVYPYLLRNLVIDHPDHVWCSDITYIALRRGFTYLTVVMDWFSRYILSWELSMSLDSEFCVRSLKRALEGGRSEIFNTDQGSQYTSNDFTGILHGSNVRISMDGRGRALDNIMVERLWRTVKYEEVYLNDYEDYFSSRDRLEDYLYFYNNERRHMSLGRRTPAEVYWGNQGPREVIA